MILLSVERFSSLQKEAEMGQNLSMQINAVNDRTELLNQLNEDSILKAQENNMVIMKNIKRLQHAIQLNERALAGLQASQSQRVTTSLVC